MKSGNYTSVCWYCGEIYQANRSRSKFCQSKHRSLFHKYGSHINPFVLDRFGNWIDADERLSRIDYNGERIQSQGWSYCYNIQSIEEKYNYCGPLPKGDEIIIVGSYAVTRILDELDREVSFYGVKDITRLTLEERASFLIIKGKL